MIRCKYLSNILILIIILSGCQSEDSVKFGEGIQLTGKPVENIQLLSKGNVRLCVADTFLVVQKSDEPFIQIYSTNSHNLLAEFGSQGRGPNEMLGPSLSKQVSYNSDNNSPTVYVFDFKRKRLNTLNIFKAIESQSFQKQEPLPSESYWLPYFFYKDDNFYLASPDRNGRFLIHNYETSENKIVPYIPSVEFNLSRQVLPIIYRSTSYVNIEKGLIASAPILLGQIDFFDLNGNLVRSTVFESPDLLKEEVSHGNGTISETKYQIADIDATGEFIFGLNYNNSTNTFYDSQRENNVKVQVFRWDGTPVKEYQLDKRLITSFAIDKTHNRIYAFDSNTKNSSIIIYNL